jgi:L-prolyl-PCP dehydrogenase
MTGDWLERSFLPKPGPQHVAARNLAAEHLPAAAPAGDGGGQFRGAWKQLAQAGLLDVLIPEGNLDVEAVLGTLEGLGEGTPNAGFLLSLGAHSFAVGSVLAHFGSESQRRGLDQMRDGSVISAFAATEAETGSDVMSLRTRCVADGDDYVVSGTKHFVTNARLADYFVVFATRDPRLNWRGITAFLVPATAPGLSVGPPERLLGLSDCGIAAVHLDAVRVPRSALLGRPGQGSAVFRHGLLWERSLLAGLAVGVLRRQLMRVIDAGASDAGPDRDRISLATELASRYVLGRLLVRDTVGQLAAGTLTPGQASLTKLWVSEAELATSRELGVASLAGLGEDSPQMSDLFNAIGATIYSGTSDIQRKIVAAELGILE